MSQNKSFLCKDLIIKVYNQGVPHLVNLIENTECLIFEDDFSEKVSDIILNYDYYPLISEKIEKLIKEKTN